MNTDTLKPAYLLKLAPVFMFVINSPLENRRTRLPCVPYSL